MAPLPPVVLISPCPLHYFSYELVRHLQRRMHSSLDGLIVSKLEEKAIKGDDHSIVAQITDDILNLSE